MVADHGIGIPASDHDRIFERFYRVDKGRSRDTGGTGLGLAIVRHVATNHGGEVQVSSQEGEGSTFVLRIPLATVDTDASQEAVATSERHEHRPTVLVVEDEASFVEALTIGLRREGFHVEVATRRVRGARALRHRPARPRAARRDAAAAQSGIDVCRQLRKKSQVPIIMVTAKGVEIDTVVGLEVGADDYVTKPYRLRELVARMRAVLRRLAGRRRRRARPGGGQRRRRLARPRGAHRRARAASRWRCRSRSSSCSTSCSPTPAGCCRATR